VRVSNITDKLLIRYSAFNWYLKKKTEYNAAGYQVFTDFMKAYDSIRREVLCICARYTKFR